ncbi:MAG: cytochrome c3 family protein, partial [Chloroflexota bacterium]
LGCLSISGLIALLIAVSFMCGSYLFFGGTLFSPGPLVAKAGEISLGGVYSHAETEGQCAACHSAPWSSESLAMRCIDCHSDVESQFISSENLHGYLINNNDKVLCRDCHTEHQGSDALITYYGGPHYPHDLFGYSLLGHEQQVDGSEFVCEDCHGDDITEFSINVCSDCHIDFEPDYIDEHATMFGNDCLACHDGVDSYQSPFDHRDVGFELGSGHADTACQDCHAYARSTADLRSASTICIDCHLEDDFHEGKFGTDCGQCHAPSSWDEFIMDHSLTSFPLLGIHQEVACQACHIDDVFAGTPTTCIDCHVQDDIHNGGLGTDCTKCHSEEGWQFATFDHSLPEARNCIACHSGIKPAGHFAGQCSACHSTDTWKGATFNHTFPLNHEGANGNCAKCHPSNANPPYSTYTCYNCHNKSKVAKEHREEKISNFQNCIRCHWDGREHD